MQKAILLAAFGLWGCGTSPDDRPHTLEYITTTILAPSCGSVNCHSAQGKSNGYVLDTVAAARESLRYMVTPGDAGASFLVAVMRGEGEPMPPSEIMPEADIQLIEAWINEGAKGVTP